MFLIVNLSPTIVKVTWVGTIVKWWWKYHKELEFMKLEFQVNIFKIFDFYKLEFHVKLKFHKFEFLKSGTLLNIFQTVVKH